MKDELTVIIVAAGKGKRFGSSIPKAYVKLNNKPILWYSLFSFQMCEFVKDIYIVVDREKIEYADKIRKKYFKKITKFKSFIFGGSERKDSVYNALNHINSNRGPAFVAIHDAARPFIKNELIKTIFIEAKKENACTCGIPVVDTLKIIDSSGYVSQHPKRKNLIAVQTPQVFKFDLLFKAYKNIIKSEKIYTDDTEIYSTINKKIKIIKGDNDLFKITFNQDLKTAKSILKKNWKLWK